MGLLWEIWKEQQSRQVKACCGERSEKPQARLEPAGRAALAARLKPPVSNRGVQ